METTNNSTCKVEVRPKNFNELIRSGYFWKPFLGVLAGGIAGFLYFRFYSCATTPCEGTNDLYSTIAMGAFWGFFIVKRPCSSCR